MRTLAFIAVLAVIASAGLPVHAAVEITYGDPDKFSDAGDRNSDPRQIMKVLADHMKATGEKILPPGTALKIEVLDLDRAGRPRGNLPSDIRIVSGKGDMPCIDLRYSLNGAAAVKERVCDPEFLRPLPFSYDPHDPLVYEKRMLDEWFERRFVKGGR